MSVLSLYMFEGGSDGTTITTGNSGKYPSGTAFSTITISATATVAYSNTQAVRGTLSGKIATGGTAGNALIQWNGLGITGTCYSRQYIYCTANPGSNHRILGMANASGTAHMAVQLLTDGKMRLVAGSGAVIATTSGSLPLNQWVRIEVTSVAGATGNQSLSYFSGSNLETTTADATISGANVSGQTTIDRNAYGISGTTVANVGPFYIDDLASSDSNVIFGGNDNVRVATKTFSFNANTTIPYTADGGSWDRDQSDPANLVRTIDTTEDSGDDTTSGTGALQTSTTGKNSSPGTTGWRLTGTWKDIFSLSAASMVSGAVATYDSKVATYTTGASSTDGILELQTSGGASTATLTPSRTYTATDGAFGRRDATPAVGWAGTAEISTTSRRWVLKATVNTGNSSSAVNTLRQDWVCLYALYRPATTSTKAHSVDAIIQASLTKTHSVDAIVQKTGTKTHSVDAIVKATLTKSHSVDAILEAPATTYTVTHSVDAVIQKTLTVAHSADAIVKATLTRTHSVDAVVKVTSTVAHSADAVIQKTGTAAHSVDAVVQATLTRTHSVDAVVLKAATVEHAADAIISLTFTVAHSVDAIVKATLTRTHSVDAVVKATLTRAHSADAVVQKAATVAHSADAVVLRTATAIHAADAIVQKTAVRSHSADAVVRKAASAEHQADAILEATLAHSHTADAVVEATLTRVHAADAYIVPEGTETHTVFHSVDARIARVGDFPRGEEAIAPRGKIRRAVGHGVDAWVYVPGAVAHGADAWVVEDEDFILLLALQ